LFIIYLVPLTPPFELLGLGDGNGFLPETECAAHTIEVICGDLEAVQAYVLLGVLQVRYHLNLFTRVAESFTDVLHAVIALGGGVESFVGECHWVLSQLPKGKASAGA